VAIVWKTQGGSFAKLGVAETAEKCSVAEEPSAAAIASEGHGRGKWYGKG
jgi:hypothetical protein